MSSQPHRADTSRRWLSFIAIFVLAGVALSTWSLSGPAGTTPDEDFHLASIWCGQGVDESHCAATASDESRSVPKDLVATSVCYAAKWDVSAGCLGTGFGHDPAPNFETGRGNFTGDYPPVYFAVMHAFVGDDISSSVLRMRAFNTLLFLSITAAVMALVPPMLRRVTAWAFLLMSVPLGIWLISSINPTGWATVSAGLLWVCLYALPDTVGWRRPTLAVVTLLVAVMGMGARTDSCLFTLIAVALVFILRRGEVLRSRLTMLVGFLISVLAVFLFLGASQSDAALNSFGELATNDLDGPALLWNNIQALPNMWTGAFGGWPLGWLDTPMPPIVLVGSLLPWAAMMFGAVKAVSGRQIIALVLLAGALVTYPLYLVTKSSLIIGEGVQPRYLLPLLVMLTGMTLLGTRARAATLSRGQVLLVVLGLSIANAFALHNNIRRYVTGLEVRSINLDRDREWWWNIPISPIAVWVIGSLAFLATVWLVLVTFSPSHDEPLPDDLAPDDALLAALDEQLAIEDAAVTEDHARGHSDPVLQLSSSHQNPDRPPGSPADLDDR